MSFVISPINMTKKEPVCTSFESTRGTTCLDQANLVIVVPSLYRTSSGTDSKYVLTSSVSRFAMCNGTQSFDDVPQSPSGANSSATVGGGVVSLESHAFSRCI